MAEPFDGPQPDDVLSLRDFMIWSVVQQGAPVSLATKLLATFTDEHPHFAPMLDAERQTLAEWQRVGGPMADAFGATVKVTPTPGRYQPAAASMATLEPSTPGQHVWVVATAHRLYDDEVLRVAAGEKVLLDAHNMAMINRPLCFVCERDWSPQVHNEPCKGDPADV